jgi:hypothetical protein
MQPLWIRLVLGVLFLLAFALIAWICLVRTHQVQRWVVEHDKWNPFIRIIRSPRYLWDIRIGGILAGISALFLAYMVIRILAGR